MKKFISSLLCLVLIFGASLPAMAAEPKLVALTYDDGPSPAKTPLLLDGLQQRGAKATFFLMGNSLKDPYERTIALNAEVAKRAQSQGHQLANHSYSHPRLTELSYDDALNEIRRTESYLCEILGDGDYFLRPPYGAYNQTVCTAAQAPVIMWSMDVAWEAPAADAKSQHDYIVKNVKDGDIILLHDWKDNDIETTFMVIDTLRQQGYEFVTVQELMRLRNVTPENGRVYTCIPNTLPFDETQLSTHWACDSILYAMEKGFMVGDGQGFKPNESLTRAMAVTLLHRCAGSPESGGSADFYDLTQDWYRDAVNWAAETGLVLGNGDGTFAPDRNMSKEEFYVLMCRWAGLSGQAKEQKLFPDDDKISFWARNNIMLLRETGFISANDVEIFRPAAAVSRAEAAELLHFLTENEVIPNA